MSSQKFLHRIECQKRRFHECDEFKKVIREVFFSFQGGFSKMYRIYRIIGNSHQGDFLFLYLKLYVLEEILGLISGSL